MSVQPAPEAPTEQAAPIAQPTPSAIASISEAAPLSERIPEQFRVFGEDQSFDIEGSASKLLESYTTLSKKTEGYEAPPESIDGYELDGEAIGEGFDVKAFMADEKNQSFLKKAHASGLNNKQVQMVLEHALTEFAPGLVSSDQQLTRENTVKQMKDLWKSAEEYNTNMNAAGRAYESMPDSIKDKINEGLGNNPVFIEVMALLGKEMAEDTPPAEVLASEQEDIQSLMMSEAYKNDQHPDHVKVNRQVSEFYQRKIKSRK